MLTKYLYGFMVISLSIFVLGCKDEWVKIELNREIKNYDEIFIMLFDEIKLRKK